MMERSSKTYGSQAYGMLRFPGVDELYVFVHSLKTSLTAGKGVVLLAPKKSFQTQRMIEWSVYFEF